MSREVLTEQQIREAYSMWRKGTSINEVASRLYVCSRTLERMFRRRGLRKVSVTKHKTNDKIL